MQCHLLTRRAGRLVMMRVRFQFRPVVVVARITLDRPHCVGNVSVRSSPVEYFFPCVRGPERHEHFLTRMAQAERNVCSRPHCYPLIRGAIGRPYNGTGQPVAPPRLSNWCPDKSGSICDYYHLAPSRPKLSENRAVYRLAIRCLSEAVWHSSCIFALRGFIAVGSASGKHRVELAATYRSREA